MVKKTYTAEQIINRLKETEVLLMRGATVGEAKILIKEGNLTSSLF